MSQRDEVREFLGARRARLTPADVGLPPSTMRRRVGDLRRDWDQVSRDVVATLHVVVGQNPYDKPLTDLIGELSSRPTVFCTLWATQDVRVHRTGIKRLRHPEVGLIELDYEVMQLPHEPGIDLIGFTAAAGTPAVDSLALLASLAASRTGEPIARP